MSKLRVRCFAVSLDGYAAGPQQSLDDPLGKGGMDLHQWFFPTKTFKSMFGEEGGTTGLDNDFAARGRDKLGAWIMGRNMFGPVRGQWPDDSWKGWWGPNPPFHVPVFVLTHHPRTPITMEGGTTFHFITGGIREAYDRARAAAGNKDICLGGGVSTIRQYLQTKLIDELHLAVAPAVLGSGEHLLGGLNLRELGYTVTEHVASPNATHIVLTRNP